MDEQRLMIVWVVECGCYSDRYVFGVYSTPEKAMEAVGNPVPDCGNKAHRHEWVRSSYEDVPSWSNGCDWGSSAYIEPVVLDGNPRNVAEIARTLSGASQGGGE